MQKDFQNLINSLQDSIFSWDYFVDFEKAKNNVEKIERELNLLNSLIGKDNIEEEFIDLIKEYPKVRSTLPILIAVRKNKLKDMSIISDVNTMTPSNKENIFYGEITAESEKELRIFFRESGLESIFKNKNIKNIVDYVFGIEVGMDTNGRKNRTGVLMENMVLKFLDNFCSKNSQFSCVNQATKKRIKEKFNFDIEIDKNDRKFDFALFNRENKKLFLIEVNYYSAGGTKLKATAGEYQKLGDFLKNQGIDLIWVTDGKGWGTAVHSLEETFNHNDYVVNLSMLRNGEFDKIVNGYA